MACGQLEIGAELAQRVEGVFVKEAERPVRHGLHLLRKHFCKSRDGIFRRAPGEMEGEEASRLTAQVGFVGPLLRKFRKLRIGQEGQVLRAVVQVEQAVEILALQPEEAGIVEIVEPLGLKVQPVDRHRRLAVLLAVGDAAGVRHVEAVHLDEAEAPARDLRFDMALHPVEDGKLGRADAVERFEVFQRHLEEGELVALEILCQRETEHRLGPGAEGVQHLDPEVDIAVCLRPRALGVVQRVRPVGRGVEPGEDGSHVSPGIPAPCARPSARRRCRGRGGQRARARSAPGRNRRRRYARRRRSRG